jgi:ubiquinone/menaquinone biosynthesis C-methylase UbiE
MKGTVPMTTTPSSSSCCAPSCCDGKSSRLPADASPDAIRAEVRSRYSQVANRGGSDRLRDLSIGIGYSAAELDGVPAEANLGVGCGNPTALAALRPGEKVLDLGAGAGLDALIAAERIGPEGRVIGVDMTPAMLARARENAVKAGIADRVEFREGNIEQLPVVDASIDVVISNCVINLSPDKPQVFREAWRVLKPGGRLAVSDIALTEKLPPALAEQAALYSACVSGAMLIDDYVAAIEAAGFVDVRLSSKGVGELLGSMFEDPGFADAVAAVGHDELQRVAGTVRSYAVEAKKP